MARSYWRKQPSWALRPGGLVGRGSRTRPRHLRVRRSRRR